MDPYLTLDEDDVPYIQVGDYELRLDLEELDDDDKERARVELRETPEVVEDAKIKLIQFIEDEKGLTLPTEDSFITKFLRPCKFYPESTFRLMKRYYKFIAKNPKYGSELMPSTVADVFENNIIEWSPQRVNGARIMTVLLANWNTKKVEMGLIFKAVIMCMEIAMIEPKTQLSGVHVILDCEGLSLSHVLQFTPSLAKLIMEFIQECTPIRLKGIHILNQPFIFNMGYAIFKPFIGQKLKNRILFHGKRYDKLQEIIPMEVLIPKYGGSAVMPFLPGSLLVDILKYFESDFRLLTRFGYVDGIPS